MPTSFKNKKRKILGSNSNHTISADVSSPSSANSPVELKMSMEGQFSDLDNSPCEFGPDDEKSRFKNNRKKSHCRKKEGRLPEIEERKSI